MRLTAKYICVLILVSSGLWAKSIQYTLSMSEPHTHLFEVEMRLEGAKGTEVVALPVWTPGSYLVRENARNVQDISNNSIVVRMPASKSPLSIDIEAINSKLKEIAGPDSFADPSQAFCEGRVCQFKSGDSFFFWDDGHMTNSGSDRAVQSILSQIQF